MCVLRQRAEFAVVAHLNDEANKEGGRKKVGFQMRAAISVVAYLNDGTGKEREKGGMRAAISARL